MSILQNAVHQSGEHLQVFSSLYLLFFFSLIIIYGSIVVPSALVRGSAAPRDGPVSKVEAQSRDAKPSEPVVVEGATAEPEPGLAGSAAAWAPGGRVPPLLEAAWWSPTGMGSQYLLGMR